MSKWNYCPNCGSAWDAWNEDATECWNCGFKQAEAETIKPEAVPDKCENHPKYKGIGAPSSDCLICWMVYKGKIEAKIKELQST